MSKSLTKLRRYRFSELDVKMLDFIKQKHRSEPDFVRSAIAEKFQREYHDSKLNYKLPI